MAKQPTPEPAEQAKIDVRVEDKPCAQKQIHYTIKKPEVSLVSEVLEEARGMFVNLLEERDVQIQTSLEPFYPSAIQKLKESRIDTEVSASIKSAMGSQSTTDQFKGISLKLTLDRTTNDVLKELKQKLRVYNKGPSGRPSFSSTKNVGSFGPMRTSEYSTRGPPNQSTPTVQQLKHNNSQYTPASSRSSFSQSLQSNGENREELCLYLFKTMARNKMLAFKKITDNEFPLRLLQFEKLDLFKDEDGFEHITSQNVITTSAAAKSKKKPQKTNEPQTKDALHRQFFVLCLLSINQIEVYLKEHGYLGGSQNQAQQPEMSNLSKSIMSNNQWERKGKLKKKGLNDDKFKERYFELEKDHLYYYKPDKKKEMSFTCIILSNANIRIYSSEQPNQAPDKLPAYIQKNFSNKNFYILEIENDSRTYVLAAKSHFDLEEWFNAIFAQIESLKTNKAMVKNAQSIVGKEKEIAVRDQALVKKLVRIDTIIHPSMQTKLLDFVNDVFIQELLFNITKYMQFADKKEYSKHAFQKADEIMKRLKEYHNILVQSNTDSKVPKPNHVNKLGNKLDSSSMNQANSQNFFVQDGYKKFKTLTQQERIACLITEVDLKYIEQAYIKMTHITPEMSKLEPDQLAQVQAGRLNRDLFNRIMSRLVRVLKHNYMNDFNRLQIQDITQRECDIIPKLGFSALGKVKGLQAIPDKEKTGKCANIFGVIGMRIQQQKARNEKAAETTAALIQANNPFAGNHRQLSLQTKANDLSSDSLVSSKQMNLPAHAGTVKLVQNTRVTKIRSDTSGKVPFVTNVQPNISAAASEKQKNEEKAKLIQTNGSREDK